MVIVVRGKPPITIKGGQQGQSPRPASIKYMSVWLHYITSVLSEEGDQLSLLLTLT